MPYLHLDLPLAVHSGARARIAGRLARLYAEVMQTSPQRPAVGFRELGEHGVLRLGADGEVEPVLLVQCDIRRGRPANGPKRLPGTGVMCGGQDSLDRAARHTAVIRAVTLPAVRAQEPAHQEA